MAVTSYEDNGKTLWRYYVNKRSALNPSIRLQRRGAGFETRKEAEKEERRQLLELTAQVVRIEVQGCSWGVVIDRWESYQTLYPSRRYTTTTINDHAQLLRNWTRPWLNRNASDLNRGDGRLIMNQAGADGKSAKFIKKLKNTVNVVFNWGIEERMIVGIHNSPVHGLDVDFRDNEKVPEILSLEQVRKLLTEARDRHHPWYFIWGVTLLTGVRNGEAHGLRKEDIEMVSPDEAQKQLRIQNGKRNFGNIRLTRAWNSRTRSYGPLKGRYWRNIPISSGLYSLLQELLKQNFGADQFGEFLLPRFKEWDNGEQAEVLRTFCREISVPSVRFHTLRACFATHLISQGVPSITVMKICGWKDLKTMERYIRLAGVDERGATEGLDFVPTQQGIMENVVRMFEFRK